MQTPTLQTGIAQTGAVRAAHNSAVALGALRAFCKEVFKNMCVIDAIVEVENAEKLFSLAAKYEMMRDDNIVDALQHIVRCVFESEDGAPHIQEEYHAILAEVMKDYSRAHAAVMQGTDAVRQYQRAVMLPCVTNMGDLEGAVISDQDADLFMRKVEHCCSLYDTNRPTGPLYDMLAMSMQ